MKRIKPSEDEMKESFKRFFHFEYYFTIFLFILTLFNPDLSLFLALAMYIKYNFVKTIINEYNKKPEDILLKSAIYGLKMASKQVGIFKKK